MIISGGDDMVPISSSVVTQTHASYREADHRIANSLQLLSALLSSEGRKVSDPIAKEALEVSIHRIGAIAGVHRQLYASDEAHIDLAAYLFDLVGRLQSSFGCGPLRKIHLEADGVRASSDFASVVGIIVTELVINACKHAYAPDQVGDIEVIWMVDPADRFTLQVSDRGGGRAPSTASAEGLGTRIVDILARKLGAEAGYACAEAGTRFVMTGMLPVA
jgi:two-component sensor histidine kinase